VDDERFDPGLLDEEDPFEVDAQAAHLFKHPHLGIDDIDDVWASGPLFYPAKPPATLAGAARSAATRPRKRLPSSTGKTGGDDNADDTR
jgi:hypothetical protein